MVKTACSSGAPDIGVGPGNYNMIFNDTCDIKNAMASAIRSKAFANGMICVAEQHITVLDSVYNQVN